MSLNKTCNLSLSSSIKNVLPAVTQMLSILEIFPTTCSTESLKGGISPSLQAICSILCTILFTYLVNTKNVPAFTLEGLAKDSLDVVRNVQFDESDQTSFFSYLTELNIDCFPTNLVDSCGQTLTQMPAALSSVKDALMNPSTFINLFSYLFVILRLLMETLKLKKRVNSNKKQFTELLFGAAELVEKKSKGDFVDLDERINAILLKQRVAKYNDEFDAHVNQLILNNKEINSVPLNFTPPPSREGSPVPVEVRGGGRSRRKKSFKKKRKHKRRTFKKKCVR